jgi:chromosomal replication initiator protein
MQEPRSSILGVLERSIGSAQVQSWFNRVELTVYSVGKVLVQYPSGFIKSWVTSYYLDQFLEAIRSVLGPVEVDFGVKLACVAPSHEAEPELEEASTYFNQLNPRFSFDTFSVSSCNRFVYDQVRFSTDNVFLKGSSGNGKSHLVQALAKDISNKGSVGYLQGYTYVQSCINALQNNEILKFKNTLGTRDLLIIDDLHLVKGKVVQEVLLEIIIFLLSQNKRLILVGDSLELLPERMISYIKGGLILELPAPSVELKFNILKQKAKPNITLEVVEYLATNLTCSIRELEGALLQIQTHILFFNNGAGLESVKQILQGSDIKPRSISTQEVLAVVAGFYGVPVSQMLSKCKTSSVAQARRVAMFLLRDLLKKSLIEIGKIFNNTTHNNALQNIRKTKQEVIQNSRLKHDIAAISDKLRGANK